MKLPSQSDGMSPFLIIELAKSATYLAPPFAVAFSILATTLEGPAPLPGFILAIAFSTVSTMIRIAGPSTELAVRLLEFRGNSFR